MALRLGVNCDYTLMIQAQIMHKPQVVEWNKLGFKWHKPEINLVKCALLTQALMTYTWMTYVKWQMWSFISISPIDI
jgi:hypothetical protein